MKNEENHQNSSKQRYYPLRSVSDHNHVDLIPITEEQYQELLPEIQRIRKQEQRAGRCRCPKQYLFKCDAMCDVCKYHRIDTLSLDRDMYSNDGNPSSLLEYLSAASDMTDDLEEAALKESLWLAVGTLEERDRAIIRHFSEGLTERQIAEHLGCSQKTVNNRKKVIILHLRKELADWA